MQMQTDAVVARSMGPSPMDEAVIVHQDPTMLRQMQLRRDELEQAGQQGRYRRGRSDERTRSGTDQ